ncbi:MAG: creatininase family protein [Acidobacteriota bacterium]
MPREHDIADRTWTEVADIMGRPARKMIALLPIGSTEPHGPHLPLATDVIISVETARRAALRLEAHDLGCLILPAVAYTVTDFSEGFSGAVGLTHETSRSMVIEICRSALTHGFAAVCLVNSHLEPEHLAALREAAAQVTRETGQPVIFPDKTQARWARRLTAEFRSGACHAGRYETSLVLACRPELVREKIRSELRPVDISIGRKIQQGARSFREAGGDRAYFGDPAAASAAEGESTYEVLAEMIATAVVEALG